MTSFLLHTRSSTLENWCREFARFAPSISVQTYYAGKEERPMLRQTLLDTTRTKVKDGWEVLITTYALAQGDERDRKFFKKISWEVRILPWTWIQHGCLIIHPQTCVFDEGHMLKNFESERYRCLLKYQAGWRLLLTGTPLQNNLQELVVSCQISTPPSPVVHNDLVVPDEFHSSGSIREKRGVPSYDLQVKG